MRIILTTTLAVVLVVSTINARTAVAQSVWQNAVNQAFSDATTPPQRPAPRVPAMYGGYGTTTPSGRVQYSPPREVLSPRGNVVRQTVPVNTQIATREPRKLPASGTTAYYGPVGEDEPTNEIVQIAYVDDVVAPPQQQTPPTVYRPTSVANVPMPSPALTESWDIEGRLERPMNVSSPQPVNTNRTAVVAPPATTTRTLYANRDAINPVATPAAMAMPRYTPMVGGNATGIAPRTVTPAPAPSLWKQLTSDFRPSNDRRWQPNLAVLPTIEFQGNHVTIRNVRYTIYQTKENYTPRYYDATYDMSSLQTLDIIVAPFPSMPSVGHVELSFGFSDGRHVILSIEPRFEEGEKDDPIGAMSNQFELMYLFADERDAVRLYTQVGRGDVFLYRLNVTPDEVRKVFESAAVRANTLAEKPEFYHGITNNCATNLFAHINYARAGAIPRDYRSRFPGVIDKLLFERKMIVTNAATFKEARENAKINWLAEQYGDIDYFSAGIRQNLF
ncbi:MAG: DUF4105 domain-containing protein [Thermoguttaceae bacterium]